MTNPMFNPQPNYSGVTIQIANPTVNTNPVLPQPGYSKNIGYISCPQAYYSNPQQPDCTIQNEGSFPSETSQKTGFQNAYPAQYYLNNYNYQGNGDLNASDIQARKRLAENSSDLIPEQNADYGHTNPEESQNAQNAVLKHYDVDTKPQTEEDMSKSISIIGDIDEREAAIKAEKKNTKEKRIIALTDEYIKSLENYLNNPNDEIRLMASKEILTRLDEDKDRYDDAALNALLNKMLQDPSKLVRIAALSAFGSQLASGNDYTISLLQNIQSNPSADKEDVLQAADILLKMSAGTEVKSIPVPKTENNEK